MKSPTSSPQGNPLRRGMTLIELTVVILVLLSLITILFIGARAYKRGSDRAGCTMQIRQLQVAVRSFANLNNFDPGVDVAPLVLEDEVIGAGKFMELAPECPAGGNYTLGGNTIPALGSLYLSCSLAGSDGHIPEDYDEW